MEKFAYGICQKKPLIIKIMFDFQKIFSRRMKGLNFI